MAFTQTQLDALDEAIATGARTVSYDGKSVTYSSLNEMLRVRATIRNELDAGNRRTTILAGFKDGRAR